MVNKKHRNYRNLNNNNDDKIGVSVPLLQNKNKAAK